MREKFSPAALLLSIVYHVSPESVSCYCGQSSGLVMDWPDNAQLWLRTAQDVQVSEQEDFWCANVVFCQFWKYTGLRSVEGVAQCLVENRAVGSQHRIGLEENLHLCTEGHHPKKGFFAYESPTC